MLPSRKIKAIIVLAIGATVVTFNAVSAFVIQRNINIYSVSDWLMYVLLTLALFFRARGKLLPAVILAAAYASIILLEFFISFFLSGRYFLPGLLQVMMPLAFSAILILYATNIGLAEHRWLWLFLALGTEILIFFFGQALMTWFYGIPYRMLILNGIVGRVMPWALTAIGFWPLRPGCDD